MRILLIIFLLSSTFAQAAEDYSLAFSKLIPSANDKHEKIIKGKLSSLFESGGKYASRSGETRTEREEHLVKHAYLLGVSMGLHHQHNSHQSLLNEHSELISRIVSFNKFIVDGKILLPTVLMATKVYEQISKTKGRRTGLSVTLDKSAEIVPRPPTWRDYLYRSIGTQLKPDVLLLPRDKDEGRVFESEFRRGWDTGVEQAKKMLDHDFARLEQAIDGHYEFRHLAAQNLVLLPVLGTQNNYVVKSTDGRTLYSNDVIFSIDSPERFESENAWRPVFMNGEQ